MFNILILAALAAGPAKAQTDVAAAAAGNRVRVEAARAEGPLHIDGRLDEPDWPRAKPHTDFTQRDPNEGQKITEETEVRVLYDDDSIYIGARLADSHPKAIKALLGRRDSQLASDSFTVYLDCYNDKRTGFYFGVSAGGTLSDGTLFNDDWDDDSWDGIWEAKTARDEKGWTAEFRIPLSQLRFKQEDEARWGVNFARTITRTNEYAQASLKPKKESGFVSRFLPLVGLQGLKPKSRLLVTPYATAKSHTAEAVPGDPFNDGRRDQGAMGVDIKLGLGSNLTLDATVNPDFGQVEVDPAVVNLTDVESFFQEKRPFFIEGSSIFGFGWGGASNNMNFNFWQPDLFYSRRVGRAPQGSIPGVPDYARTPDGTRINGALKLTGKVAGNWNVGLLQAFTGRAQANLVTAGRASTAVVEPASSYSLVRGQRDFLKGRRGLGFMGTFVKRDLANTGLQAQLNDHAAAFGVDGWTSFGNANEKVWALTGRMSFSSVSGSRARMLALQRGSQHYYQRPDATHVEVDPNATRLSGYTYRVALNREKGPFLFNAAYGVISPGFDSNDVGFTFRGDQKNGHLAAGYRWTKPGRLFRNAGFQAGAFRTDDFGGNMTSLGLFSFSWARLKNYWGVNASVFVSPETINVAATRGGVAMLRPSSWSWDASVNSDDRKRVTFSAGTRGGYGESGSSYERGVSVSASWKPAPNVSISVSPDYSSERNGAQFVRNIVDPSATATLGTRHVFAHLTQKTFSGGVRVNWTFTPALSLQTYFQPLIGSGEYSDFGELARPRSYEFVRYAAGTLPPGVSDPAFTFKSIRGNAVLRWEFRPGSSAYFVWTQNRQDTDPSGEFRLRHSFSTLLDAQADNIFLVKLAFGWSR